MANVDRRKTGHILFHALNCAISDRESLIDAYSDDKNEPAVKNARADIAAFENLKKRLFPGRMTMNEVIVARSHKITLSELRNIIEMTS